MEVEVKSAKQLHEDGKRQVQRVYAVYDMKMKLFLAPFVTRNSAVATRMFADSVNGENNVVAKHPEDFALYQIGEFDEESGLLVSTQPVNLGLASQFVNETKGNGDARALA